MLRSALPASWLRALSDARLAPALQRLHGDPTRNWHLDELARAEVAQTLDYASESAFSHAFKRETGQSPNAFRRAVRLQQAQR